MNPKTALVTSLSEAAETFPPNQTSFRAHIDATYDWDAKTWYSGDRPITEADWIDNSADSHGRTKMPYLHDIGISIFYRTNNHRDLWIVENCLYILSSTDLPTHSEFEIELLCNNSSGIFNLGPIAYNSYRTKCSESSGIIAHPTEEMVKWTDTNIRHFWTKIHRTGPSEGIILEILTSSYLVAYFDEWL